MFLFKTLCNLEGAMTIFRLIKSLNKIIFAGFVLALTPYTAFATDSTQSGKNDSFSPYKQPAILFDQSFLEDKAIALKSSDQIDMICEKAFIENRLKMCRSEILYKSIIPSIVPPTLISSLSLGIFLASYNGRLRRAVLEAIFEQKTEYINQVYVPAFDAEGFPVVDFHCTTRLGGALFACGACGTAAFAVSLLFYTKTLIEQCKAGYGVFSLMRNTKNDPMFAYGRQYAIKKRKLNFLDAEEDQKLFKQYGRIPYIEEAFVSENLPVLDAFLAIPTESINPIFSANSAAQLFGLYSKEAQRTLTKVCLGHMNSYRDALGINDNLREFLNLVSPPGVGKSALVNNIGKLMGLPVETICLAGLSPAKIFGSETEPGLLVSKLGQLGCRNGILFFDELDRITDNKELLSMLLPFLEPSEKKFYSPYLKRHIDVSHLFIVVAGNFSFKDQALNSRFNALKTVKLEIGSIDNFIKIIIDGYATARLLPKELAKMTSQLKLQWEEQVRKHIVEQEYISFRDAHAKVDSLLGDWRMSDDYLG